MWWLLEGRGVSVLSSKNLVKPRPCVSLFPPLSPRHAPSELSWWVLVMALCLRAAPPCLPWVVSPGGWPDLTHRFLRGQGPSDVYRQMHNTASMPSAAARIGVAVAAVEPGPSSSASISSPTPSRWSVLAALTSALTHTHTHGAFGHCRSCAFSALWRFARARYPWLCAPKPFFYAHPTFAFAFALWAPAARISG